MFKKTYFQQNSFKEKFKFDIFKDRIKNIYFKKLIIFLSDYIINDVLETKNNISKFLQKKNINFFCTSHNTLISNTIRETLNKKNIKSFTLLHGGTVGHFNHGFFWPDLAHQNLKNKKISFNQTYSNNHSKELKKNNHSYKLNKKSEYISFKSETFFNLKNLKKRRKSSFNIGYITQSNSNILFNLNRGNNDPLNLYKFRTNLLNEILKRYKKFKLLVSLTETSDDLFCEQNILEKAKKMNMIKIYNWNAIEILKKADLLILEQPSTTLIESLFLDVSKIIIINNPLWDFNYSQKKILSNRVSFANTYDDIISFILKKNKKKTNNLFLKKYYQPKKNKEINYFLNKMLI
ncbi:MAG: hypothetical protein CMM99_04840 [Rickettsiales bacterium]|nr:hypothetical protein [Rickettsiales bacterium]